MANELKPWKYDIQYGPEGEENYAWVYDDRGDMIATMKTHKAKEIVDRMNTRPAPPGEGLERFGVKSGGISKRADGVFCKVEQAEAIIAAKEAEIAELKKSLADREWISNKHNEHRAKYKADNAALTALVEGLRNVGHIDQEYVVTRSQAEAIIAAERVEVQRWKKCIGERDEKYTLLYKEHKQLKADNAALQSDVAGSASVIEHLTRRAEKAEADLQTHIVGSTELIDEKIDAEFKAIDLEKDNAALTARVKELEGLIDGENCAEPDKIDALFRRAEITEVRVKELEKINADLCRSHGVLNVTGAKLETKVEALEIQLAAARKALKRQGDNMAFALNHNSFPEHWYLKFTKELEEDRAALEAKP